jgi:AcrR family transcriptional regulator
VTPNPSPESQCEKPEETKRPYGLGKRLEQMDQNRAAVLQAARDQLETVGYHQLTMGSLAAATGLTRQTVHNLFGTKVAVLECLFDVIARDGGMLAMRDAMTQPTPQAMLARFVEIFCKFWASNRILFRRIHGIGAIDPEFGAVLEERNQRRHGLATRITQQLSVKETPREILARNAAALTALTSFEFYDSLVENLSPGDYAGTAQAVILELAHKLFTETRSQAPSDPRGQH